MNCLTWSTCLWRKKSCGNQRVFFSSNFETDAVLYIGIRQYRYDISFNQLMNSDMPLDYESHHGNAHGLFIA